MRERADWPRRLQAVALLLLPLAAVALALISPASADDVETGEYQAVALGYFHGCAIETDGTLTCWGRNTHGEANPPDGTYKAIDLGSIHSCAIATDDTIACWGDNSFEQTTSPSGTFKELVVGARHACAIAMDDTLSCWGYNSFLQNVAPEGTFTDVAIGWEHTCVIDTDGEITCWGYGHPRANRHPVSGEFKALTAGQVHTCGIKLDDKIECWGENYRDYNATVAPSGTFKSFDSGNYHSCAIDFDDELTCWGDNEGGKATPPDGTYESLDLGGNHSCALDADDGSVVCWGPSWADHVDAPEGSFTAVEASQFTTCAITTEESITCWGDQRFAMVHELEGEFRAVVSGSHHNCALAIDDTITCWGINEVGQIEAPSGAYRTLDTSYDHTCALTYDDTLVCWGYDQSGQTNPPSGSFQSVSAGDEHTCGIRTDDSLACWGFASWFRGIPPGTFKSVDSGARHNCAIRADDTLACWGDNAHGQSDAPAGAYQSVGVGNDYSCALKSDGALTCWGSNERRTLNAPSGTYKTLVVGEKHSCAIATDDSVACWGHSDFGQLNVPSGAFTALELGEYHACALRTNGRVACWGDNFVFQSDPPSGRFRSVSAADHQSCGIRRNRKVTCWPKPPAGLTWGSGHFLREQELPEVSVTFELASDTVAEGDSVTVRARLSADPERTVVIPLTTTLQGGASNADFSEVPAELRFEGVSEQSFVFTAATDRIEDAGESVLIELGELPALVTRGSPDAISISLVDMFTDPVTTTLASFRQATYELREGSSACVVVELSSAPLESTVIGLTTDVYGGVSHGDITGLRSSLTFNSGESTQSLCISFAKDSVDEGGGTVVFGLRDLPDGYATGSPSKATVAIIDATLPVSTLGGAGGGGGGGGGGGPPPAPIPSDEDFDWNVTRDIDRLDRDHDGPTGLWSNGETLWVLENAASGADALFAYDLMTGERQPDEEFELDRRNRFAHGIWSDGKVVWISDSGQDKLFAYELESGERIEERDLELHERNRDPRGIWSDEQIWYVLDSVKDALFVYGFESGEPMGEYPLAKLNKSPRGIWSDGVTNWVSDDGAKRLFAYRIEEDENGVSVLKRYEDEEFTFRSLFKAGNTAPRGIWSNGDTIWVVDEQDGKVYSYNLPDAIIPQLASLSLRGVEIGEFSPHRTEYTGVVIDAAETSTVDAAPVAEGADVAIQPSDLDADPDNGHQVALTEGGVIAITVTSPDGSRSLVYRLGLGVAPGAAGCFAGPTGGRLQAVAFAGGGLDELDDCARASRVSALFFHDGKAWLAYAPGLPEPFNAAFLARFAEGLPADTPLQLVIGRPADEPPVVSGPEQVEYAEGGGEPVALYTSEDPEGGATVWSLAGADADAFSLRGGALRFRERPDYERPGDADEDNRYELTLRSYDGARSASLPVRVQVVNVDEGGALQLSSRQPSVGVPLTARLDDPDGASEPIWSWQRSDTPSGDWTPVAGAAGPRYRPTAADLGSYLRVTADYADGHGAGKQARTTSEFAVQAAQNQNTAPRFPADRFERSVAERSPAGAAIGAPLGADDGEDERLTYALASQDAPAPFTIEAGTGQLRVAVGVELDYERQERYQFTVSATDPFGAADTTAVVVQVIDRNDPPLARDDFVETEEDAAVTIAVLANDADADGDELSVSRFTAPRNGTATVKADGTITYTPRRDFYGVDRFRYRLADAELAAVAMVSVVIRPVNDPPAFGADSLERALDADAQPGDPLGEPVSASDAEGDALRYALSGPDAALFAIHPVSGQIVIAPEAELEAKRSVYELAVEASDPEGGTASIELLVSVRPGPAADPAADDFAWTETADLDALAPANRSPAGLWSNGETLWVVDRESTDDSRLFAYDLADGVRAPEAELALDPLNREPFGLWSDGEIVWVGDGAAGRLFAYELESGERIVEREITLRGANREPHGIWSDGETIYVLDGAADALFAYQLATGEARAEYRLDRLNKNPRGLWSDGVSFWVSDPGGKRLFAYRISERDGEPRLARREAEEFTFRSLFRAGNNQPSGIWSDGELMFAADAEDARIYSYRLPNALVARLASLRLSELDLDSFSAERTEYEARARRHLTLTTVEAQPSRAGATVSIWPADADAEPANGHQARVRAGAQITVTVESADGSRSRSYLVRIGELPPLRHCFAGLSAERLNQLTFAGGSLDELDRCARAQRLEALFFRNKDTDAWLSYIPALPTAFNQAFRDRFAGGVPALTRFLALTGN